MNYPSVTQVLPKIDFYCTPSQLEAARQDGIVNHELIEKYFNSNGDTFGDPYLEKFDEFYHNNMSWNVLQCEQRLYSDKHKFSGKPDVIFEKGIVDIKRTFYNAKYHALQLAGYSLLSKENKILSTKKWYVIYFDGEFKIKNVYNPQAEDIFLSLVRKYYIDAAVENYLKSI